MTLSSQWGASKLCNNTVFLGFFLKKPWSSASEFLPLALDLQCCPCPRGASLVLQPLWFVKAVAAVELMVGLHLNRGEHLEVIGMEKVSNFFVWRKFVGKKNGVVILISLNNQHRKPQHGPGFNRDGFV